MQNNEKSDQGFNLFRPVQHTHKTRTQSAPTFTSTEKASVDANTRSASTPAIFQTESMMFPISLNVDEKFSFTVHKARFSQALENIREKKTNSGM